MTFFSQYKSPKLFTNNNNNSNFRMIIRQIFLGVGKGVNWIRKSITFNNKISVFITNYYFTNSLNTNLHAIYNFFASFASFCVMSVYLTVCHY